MNTLDQSLANLGITAPSTPQPKRRGLLKAMFTGNLDDRHRRTLARVAYGLGDPTALQAWQAQDARQQEEMMKMAELEAQERELQKQREHDLALIKARQKAGGAKQMWGDVEYGEDAEGNPVAISHNRGNNTYSVSPPPRS